MSDGEVAAERRQCRLVEDLRDEAELLVDDNRRAVRHRHAGRFLAAVLQGVEPEVGELGDVLTGSPHPEHPAGILGRLLVVVQVGS